MRLEEWPQSVELVARAALTRVDPIGFFLYSDSGETELLLPEYRIPPKNDQNMKSMYVSVLKLPPQGSGGLTAVCGQGCFNIV